VGGFVLDLLAARTVPGPDPEGIVVNNDRADDRINQMRGQAWCRTRVREVATAPASDLMTTVRA
jgi:hypothetical protein